MSTKIIDSVDRFRIIDPLFECVRIVLSYLGESHTPSYVQGISGSAFRVAGICPCAPTCSFALRTTELPGVFGYDVETIPVDVTGWSQEYAAQLAKLLLSGQEPTDSQQRKDLGLFKQRSDTFMERVKDEIRKGRPVITWNAFTVCEWDVVCGFDEDKKLFHGRGSYLGLKDYATASWLRPVTCFDTCPAGGGLVITQKRGAFNAQESEIRALEEAARHANSRLNADKLGGTDWVFLEGFMAYDRWVSDYRSVPTKKPNMGDRYCLGVYGSTHRAASDFLKEIAPKYPEARKSLEEAADHFMAESAKLNECARLMFPEWKLPARPDAALNKLASELLGAASKHYMEAIREIETALSMMDRS